MENPHGDGEELGGVNGDLDAGVGRLGVEKLQGGCSRQGSIGLSKWKEVVVVIMGGEKPDPFSPPFATIGRSSMFPSNRNEPARCPRMTHCEPGHRASAAGNPQTWLGREGSGFGQGVAPHGETLGWLQSGCRECAE